MVHWLTAAAIAVTFFSLGFGVGALWAAMDIDPDEGVDP